VEVEIYNVAGQRVATLVHEYRAPGIYRVTWAGESERGEAVASGVYFVRMRAGSFVETRKVILLK
jgi:flagellar hook assembly protein FlgD